MTYQEKGVWAGLLTTLVIYGGYFVAVCPLSEAGTMSTIVLFGCAVVAQIVALIVLHSLFAVTSDSDLTDERDTSIEWKGYRTAYAVLAVGVVLSIGGLVWREVKEGMSVGDGSAGTLTPFVIAHILLLCFVMAEAAKYVTQILCYRRGY